MRIGIETGLESQLGLELGLESLDVVWKLEPEPEWYWKLENVAVNVNC